MTRRNEAIREVVPAFALPLIKNGIYIVKCRGGVQSNQRGENRGRQGQPKDSVGAHRSNRTKSHRSNCANAHAWRTFGYRPGSRTGETNRAEAKVDWQLSYSSILDSLTNRGATF